MSYRSILVHVDATETGRARLRNAVDLARRWSAHLVGLGAEGLDPAYYRTGSSFEYVRKYIEERLSESEAAFRELTADLASCEWRAEILPPVSALTRLACGADLIVASRRGDNDAADLFPDPGEVVLAAGTPVLVEPTQARPLEGRNVVVGWKNTREARRAVSDALPALRSAVRVQVLRFVRDAREPEVDGLDNLVERLRRHGVAATGERRDRGARSVAEDLIAAAEDIGADLVVTGGFGRPRLRELVLGGVTSGLLQHARQYVLFGH